MFLCMYLDETAVTDIRRNKISKLIITVSSNKNQIAMKDSMNTIYTYIFTVFKNLHYLNICSTSNMYNHHLSFNEIFPNLFSSTLTELYLELEHFSDCLYLLDGRFNQLRTFYVKVLFINRRFLVTNNKVS